MLFVETQNKEKRQFWRCNTNLRKIVENKVQQYKNMILEDWKQIKNTLCDHLKARGTQENAKKRERKPWLKNHAKEDPPEGTRHHWKYGAVQHGPDL